MKNCSRCDCEMECTGSNDCWCFTLPYIRLDITESYNDCLCKQCLIELTNARSQNNNQG